MELWIVLSLLGGALQAFRVAGQRLLAQKHQGGRVVPSDAASPFGRVVLGVPVACIALGIAAWQQDTALAPIWLGPHLGTFWFWVFAVAFLQMAATVVQTRLVSRRNFALGIVYVKVLIPAMAVIGVVVFNDRFSVSEWAAIGIGTVGLGLMSYGKVAGQANLQWDWMTVVLGLGAGLILAVTGLAAREAVDALPQDDMGSVVRGIAALACMASVQLVASAAFIAVRDAREFLDLWDRWPTVMYTSLFSVGGSLCWFIAFALAHPALVNLVGQSEFFFALGISILFFRDWPTRGELAGMAIMAVGIWVILWI